MGKVRPTTDDSAIVASEEIGPTAEDGAICGTQRDRRPLVNLSFKVSREFRRRFKRLAVDADLKNVELLRRAIEGYEREQENAPDTARQRRLE